MDNTNLQETAARLDAKIDALAVAMKTGFANAFEQTQGGFDDFQAFAIFMRTETAEQFKQVHHRFDGLERRFDGLERRFDGLEGRFDRLEKLIKER
jgi:hypothetical protein